MSFTKAQADDDVVLGLMSLYVLMDNKQMGESFFCLYSCNFPVHHMVKDDKQEKDNSNNWVIFHCLYSCRYDSSSDRSGQKSAANKIAK